MKSYPIYLLDLGGNVTIVFPDGKVDLDHCEFWEAKVAQTIARHFRVPLEELLNLPYCQRRARISGNVVFFGERTSQKLLRLIEKAVGETGLRFVYDDHEKRLDYDVMEFTALCLQS